MSMIMPWSKWNQTRLLICHVILKLYPYDTSVFGWSSMAVTRSPFNLAIVCGFCVATVGIFCKWKIVSTRFWTGYQRISHIFDTSHNYCWWIVLNWVFNVLSYCCPFIINSLYSVIWKLLVCAMLSFYTCPDWLPSLYVTVMWICGVPSLLLDFG